jgi:hypothetical protein
MSESTLPRLSDEMSAEFFAADDHADVIRNETADLERMEEIEIARQSMIREQMLAALRAIDGLPIDARGQAAKAVLWLGTELGVA